MNLLLTGLLAISVLSGNLLQEGPKHQISIYFGGGSYYISENQRIAIAEFLQKIPHVEQFNITIHSHTDNIGGVEFNDWLSKMRSRSALEELLLNNIRKEMIEIKDFGLHNPVYDNSTWEGKLKNRRVDIFLWPMAL
ncbi:MAG: OmpA family protein [Cytophagales bacterium]|nr:OmpA family protein [Cytophagales bacterium]